MPTASDRRLQLHEILCRILGSRNVYFQPPESVKMNYPAIVYSLADIDNDYADDGVYLSHRRYKITLIDKDPDSIFIDKLAALPGIKWNRPYQSDNLNHSVFNYYY